MPKFILSFLMAFSLASTLLLTGCSLLEPKPVVPVYVTTVTVPDDALLLNCQVEAPPAKSTYMAANMSGREKLLVDHSAQQMTNLFKCNERMGKLREWKEEVLKKGTKPK